MSKVQPYLHQSDMENPIYEVFLLTKSEDGSKIEVELASSCKNNTLTALEASGYLLNENNTHLAKATAVSGVKLNRILRTIRFSATNNGTNPRLYPRIVGRKDDLRIVGNHLPNTLQAGYCIINNNLYLLETESVAFAKALNHNTKESDITAKEYLELFSKRKLLNWIDFDDSTPDYDQFDERSNDELATEP
ncbi:MAG: hypothetical protein EOP48_33705, partial [Sphingobacteriales bacterium]